MEYVSLHDVQIIDHNENPPRERKDPPSLTCMHPTTMRFLESRVLLSPLQMNRVYKLRVRLHHHRPY